MALDNEKNNINKNVRKPSSIQTNNIFNFDETEKSVNGSVGGETKVVKKQRTVPQKSSRVKQVNLNIQTNDSLVEADSLKSREALKKSREQNAAVKNDTSGRRAASANEAVQRKKPEANKPEASVNYADERQKQGRRVIKQDPDSKPLKKSSAISSERIKEFVSSKNPSEKMEAANNKVNNSEDLRNRYGYKKEPVGESYVASSVSGRVRAFSQAVLPDAGNELTRSDKINDRRVVLKRERKLLKIGADASKETAEFSSVFEPEEKTFGSAQKNAIEAARAIAASNAAARLDQSTMRIPRPSEEMLRASAAESSNGRSRVKKVNDFGNTQPIGVIPEGARDSVFPLPEEERPDEREQQAYLKRVKVNDYAASSGKTRTRPWLKWVIIIIILIFCIAGFLFCRAVFDDSPMNQSSSVKYEFTVDENTTNDTVADYLVENGMVENKLFYKIRAKFFDADYVPGTYEISPSYSTEKIINILSGFDYNSDSDN